MRVIHVLDHSIPVETPYAMHTMAILASQRALGWETFQLTGPNHGGDTATEEEVDGWMFYRTPRPGGILEGIPGLAALEFMGEIAYRIERLARRVRPHILHAHSPVLNAIPALHAGRRLGIPVVYDARVLDEQTARRAGATGLPPGLSRRIETWALKRADAVTTECEALGRDIIDRGVPAGKVTVIPCAEPLSDALARDAAPANDRSGIDELHGGRSYCRVYEHLMGAT
jgi:hypothetical protein